MLAPIDWDNRPEKFCFVACPDEVWCECRARARHESWKLAFKRFDDEFLKDKFLKDNVGLSEPQQPKDSDRS